MNLYLGPLCVILNYEAAGSVKLACLDALGGPVTHITASSGAVADRMMWPIFCIFAVLVMSLPLLLVILSLLRDSVRSRGRLREQVKTMSYGSRPLDPDFDDIFPLLNHPEDFH